MGALDKLINLLEQVKETNPDFSSKAEKALDVLINEEATEQEEDQFVEPEEVEEEPFDDSYVEIDNKDLYDVLSKQQRTTQLVTQLGLITQNYEVDKESVLEEMEEVQKGIHNLMDSLKDKYSLDRSSNYDLVFPNDNARNQEVAAFVKK
jgi:hypothetical protein